MPELDMPLDSYEWKNFLKQLADAQKLGNVPEPEVYYIEQVFESFQQDYPHLKYRFYSIDNTIVEKTQKIAQLIDDVSFPFKTATLYALMDLVDSTYPERFTQFESRNSIWLGVTIQDVETLFEYSPTDTLVANLSIVTPQEVASIDLSNDFGGAFKVVDESVYIDDTSKLLDPTLSFSVVMTLEDGRQYTDSIKVPQYWFPYVTNSISWYDGADVSNIIESGNIISRWNDKVSNGYHLNQTYTNPPRTNTRTLNSFNVVDFTGSVYSFIGRNVYPLPSSGDLAIFMVSEIDIVNNVKDSLVSTLAVDPDFEYRSNNASQFNGQINTTDDPSVSLSGGPFPGPSIHGLIFDYEDQSTMSAYVDGTLRGSGNYNFRLHTPNNLIFGTSKDATGSFDGGMAEIIVTEDITIETRQKIEGHLAHKWGLLDNLPTSHPYKNEAPLF
jgi:hypothetical protein